MTYQQFKILKPSAFKRRCGIQLETFEQMVEILRPHLDRRGRRGGQAKLTVEDQLLLVLEYWRKVWWGKLPPPSFTRVPHPISHRHQLGLK